MKGKENRINEVILKATGKVLEKQRKREMTDWPPQCTFIFYQPKRPVKRDE